MLFEGQLKPTPVMDTSKITLLMQFTEKRTEKSFIACTSQFAKIDS